MEKLTIALLSGGVSSEREVSLNSGAQVYEALDKTKYEVIRYDPKTDLARLVTDAPRLDAAMIILHGPYGEDGTVQGMLDLLNVPYQGTGVLGSALAMNKLAAKRIYEQVGLRVPAYKILQKGEPAEPGAWVGEMGLPIVVKPVSGGSSIGMDIVRSEADLAQAVDTAFEYDGMVMLEAYVEGVELTGGVIGNDHPEALPIIEIIPEQGHAFFDYVAKYTAGVAREICPARIDEETTRCAQACSVKAHEALFCKGYSRTDMILKDGELYVLETNTIPGMTPTSLFPQAAQAAGLSFGQLLDRLIDLSLEAHGNG